MRLNETSYQVPFQEMIHPSKVLVHQFDDDGTVPNNAKLALIIYQNALTVPEQKPAKFVEQVLARNHWEAAQSAGLFVQHHYHSTAHEVLAVVSGSATIQLGGPQGIIHTLRAGDVAIIPAGVAHQKLRTTPDFDFISAFPTGQARDFCVGQLGERPQADRNIARVTLPKADPVYGAQGPLLELWTD